MILFPWCRAGESWDVDGVSVHLLTPEASISNELAILSQCWLIARLRRYHSFVVVYPASDLVVHPDDHSYVDSLQRLNTTHGVEALCVGHGDVLPFLPLSSEDGGLLLLEGPLKDPLPPTGRVVSSLGGVLVSAADQYMKIEHTNPRVDEWLSLLPHIDPSRQG